jgi:nitrile hydratase subunit beta
MDGAVGAVFDMGGVREWFGPIPVEANEPVFHHRWEGRVFASTLMSIAVLGYTEEGFRWTTERLPRAQYVTSYYRRWLATLEQMAIDKGVLAPGELEAHLAGKQPTARGQVRPGLLHRDLAREVVRTAVGPMPAWKARLYARIEDTHLPKRARFAIGEHVTVSSAPADGHTRRPRYTWGKRGTIVGYHYATVLPERSARGEHGGNEHFYTVEFDGRDLWGDDAEPGTAVRIGLFESYLEATS